MLEITHLWRLLTYDPSFSVNPCWILPIITTVVTIAPDTSLDFSFITIISQEELINSNSIVSEEYMAQKGWVTASIKWQAIFQLKPTQPCTPQGSWCLWPLKSSFPRHPQINSPTELTPLKFLHINYSPHPLFKTGHLPLHSSISKDYSHAHLSQDIKMLLHRSQD